jgi:hypothetical protein
MDLNSDCNRLALSFDGLSHDLFFFVECACVQNLMHAKLDQSRRCVEIEYASARDVSVDEVASMVQTLTQWFVELAFIRKSFPFARSNSM